ncbi:cytochrome P450 [Mycena pura]|uniref:Cytochrome P450 n=1 Tax=Mycena pura TaxID=153505 RepID=A0AAD6YLP6_9AGAR|nr:cytochrome P450 [Mycena pura]
MFTQLASDLDPQSILVSVGLISLVYALLKVTRGGFLADAPMPPQPSWLWGHDREVYENDVGVSYTKWLNQYGYIAKIRGAFFHPEILLVADTKACTHILQTHIYDYYHSVVVRPRIERLLGRSLGWVEGASEHKRMRALVAPALSPESIRAMAPQIYAAAEDARNQAEQEIPAGGGYQVVNAMDLTGKTTLDITGRVAFDHDFQLGQSNDAQTILQAWRRMVNIGMQWKGFMAIVLLRRFPWLNHLPIKSNRGQSVVKVTIQQGVAKELVVRSQQMEDPASLKSKDLMSILLKANAQGKIDQQELMDHITMFLMAGHETTGQTLAYTLWELGKRPDIQAKLREEVQAYPGNPTYDEIVGSTALPYLDAVTKEALRMFPALPYMERVATRDDVLPLQTPIATPDGRTITALPIKKGQIIVLPIIAINRLDATWGDPMNFRPERWFEQHPSPELLPHGWGNTLTFSEGPRNCVGYRLGIFQFKVVLMTFMRTLKFEDTGAKLGHVMCSSLQPYVIGQRDQGPNIPVRISVH